MKQEKYKILKKIIRIILMAVFLIIIITMQNKSYCDTYIPKTGTSESVDSNIVRISEAIIGLVKFICYGIGIGMLIMLGAKWLGASPEGKANIKQTSIQYIIGAFILIAAGTILQIIETLARTVYF